MGKKIFILAAIFLVVILAIYIAIGIETTNKAPYIEFEKEIIDAGLVGKGKELTYKFPFKNSGNAQLIIKEASVGCSCATVKKLEKDKYLPGESGMISINIDLSSGHGIFKKVCQVKTNDPIRPTLFLELTARVKSIIASPKSVLIRHKQDEKVNKKVDVLTYGYKDVNLKSIKMSSDSMTASFKKDVYEGGFERLIGSLSINTPEYPVGTHHENMTLLFDTESGEVAVEVPILLTVETSLTINPSQLCFSRIIRGKEAKLECEIEVADSEVIALEVEGTIDDCSCKLIDHKDGTYRLEVNWIPDEEGLVTGTVFLKSKGAVIGEIPMWGNVGNGL